jgi:hypothetical protein
MERSLAERVERVRAKALARRVRLDPPLAEADLRAFEARAGVPLPEGYRAFLLVVGDGPRQRVDREGPPHYGLRPLAETLVDEDGDPLRPAAPFPLTGAWVWEDEPDPDQERLRAVFQDGHLYLGTEGCGEDWIVVVAGPERGRVWDRADVGAQPCDPPCDFLDWYERWLDGKPYWPPAAAGRP